jgi:serine/threonine-protein kinase
VALVGQLAGALDVAHGHGLLHRDVKLSNALVAMEGADEHVYLADFGLTKHITTVGGVTASDQLVGTVDYLAPERICGERSDGRADLYSLGCVLFECLTGEVPFARESDVATIYAHLEDDPPRPSERRPGLPAALDAVLERALAKDPAQRFPTGAELAGAARAALTATSTAPRTRVWVSRAAPRPGRALVALAAVVAALAAAVIMIVHRSGGSRLALADADEVAVIDPGGRSLVGEVPTGSSPSQLAVGAGAVWVTNPDAGTLSRIDRRTGTVSNTIQVGSDPSAVAVGAGGVWVVSPRDGTLSWISPATNQVVKTIRVGNGPSGVCVAAGAVWVADSYAAQLVRFDPTTQRKTRIPLDSRPTQLACGGGSVWASSRSSGTVTQVDAATGDRLATAATGAGASGLAFGDGALWVANTQDGTVSRIDPRRGVQTALVPSAPTTGRQASRSTSAACGSATSWRAPWRASIRAGTPSSIGCRSATARRAWRWSTELCGSVCARRAAGTAAARSASWASRSRCGRATSPTSTRPLGGWARGS